MKLKYILPVTAIASVATVVTPLATSCGQSSTVKWEAGKSLKLSYSPLSPEEVAFTSYDECNESFANFIKKNPKAFAEGVALWFVEGHLSHDADPENASNDITKVEIKVDNVDATMNKRQDKQEFVDTTSKSFKVSLSGRIDAWFKFANKKIEFKDSYFEIKNIPVYYDCGDMTTTMEYPNMSSGEGKNIGWWTNNQDWSANLPEVTMSGQDFVVGENKTFDCKSPVPEEEVESLPSFVAYYVMDYLTQSVPYTYMFSRVYKTK